MISQLDQLVSLTRTLGEPQRDYVIVGEGNTSCRIDDEAFYIKASGQGMEGIEAGGFVGVRFAPILRMLDDPPATLTEQNNIMQAAKLLPDAPLRPSVEVSFHAMLLATCNVLFIGHTHPVAINQILCSTRAEQFAASRIFPDEVVLCGPESVFIPYVDPGLPLAIVMRQRVREYMQRYDEAPRVILMANHGMIALGQTPQEILNITAMCVKAAAIFAGACAVGGPVFMNKQDIMHIYRRPDEIYRRSRFVSE